MSFSITLQTVNVRILYFSTTAITNILHRNLKLVSIPWDTMATFVVSFTATVTDDGFNSPDLNLEDCNDKK